MVTISGSGLALSSSTSEMLAYKMLQPGFIYLLILMKEGRREGTKQMVSVGSSTRVYLRILTILLKAEEEFQKDNIPERQDWGGRWCLVKVRPPQFQ